MHDYSMKTASDDAHGVVAMNGVIDGVARAEDHDQREPSTCDKILRFVLILLAGLLICASVTSLIGGSLLHQSVSSLPFANCMIFKAVSISAVVGGVGFVLCGVGLALHLFRDKMAGMICADGQTLLRKMIRFGGCFAIPFMITLLLIGLSIGSIALYTLSLQVPNINENFSAVPGISGAVTIARDVNGLVHINASSVEDALFGQGFAQAQDRLWQLEFQRLAAQGRLAEFVGSAALDVDKQVRTLNFNQAAQDMCDSMKPDEAALLLAFIGGINYFIANVKVRPPEFMFMSKRLLFFHEPDPFVPLDVCLTAKLLQWQLSFNVALEVERFNTFWRTSRSYDQVEEMYTNMTNISHTILNASQMGFSESDAQAARQREYSDHVIERNLYDTYMTTLRAAKGSSPSSDASDSFSKKSSKKASKLHFDLFSMKQMHASNAWAARGSGDGTQSAHGASDPHLKINLPSVWYYSHLTATINASLTMDYSGVGMTGIPGCQIGKNNFVSWGITMSLTDLEDLFLMVPDPANPTTKYMFNGVSVPYTYRTETIKVKGEDSVVLQVRESVLGPVVTDVMDELPRELIFCVNATALRPDNTSITGLTGLLSPSMMTVKDLRDTGLGLLRSPGFSITAADHEGTIGYFMTGAHPIRAPGHTGKYPTLGNGSYPYAGTIAYAELPTLLIPASQSDAAPSYIAAANQKIYPDGYRYTLGYDYVYPWRGGRIQDLLEANLGNLSTAALHKKIQRDTFSNTWAEFRNVLANTTAGTAGAAFNAALTTAGATWRTRLLQWDGRSTMGAIEPTFFFLWLRTLTAVPQDVIAAGIQANSKAQPYYPADRPYALQVLANPTPTMTAQCSKQTTPPGGSCVQLAADRFNEAAAGGAQLRWGIDINQLTGVHLMMHKTILACLFERTVDKDGDFSTVDVADFGTRQAEMAPDAASSMRQLYDWGLPSSVQFSFPGGDSGNPYSHYYDNLFAPFSGDDYVNVTVVGLPSVVAASQNLFP